jgi:outer membrane protein OmpA-like peptidoglycan-associated protein
MEADLKASVDQALVVKGLHSVKADVSGQTVTLTTATDTPEAKAQLAVAQTTLSAVTMNEPVMPGGKLVNSPISAVQVVGTPTLVAMKSAASSVAAALPVKLADKTRAIEIIHGDGATAVASLNTPADDLPRVAGDSALDASTQAARSCDQDIAGAISSRQVSYKPGTYDLTPESQALIGDVYKVVAACPVQVRLTVSGYTDNLGDGMVNQTISQARAQAAADALIARGLAPGRVTVRGFGGALPVADNTTAEGRARNRRVVFTVNAG